MSTSSSSSSSAAAAAAAAAAVLVGALVLPLQNLSAHSLHSLHYHQRAQVSILLRRRFSQDISRAALKVVS